MPRGELRAEWLAAVEGWGAVNVISLGGGFLVPRGLVVCCRRDPEKCRQLPHRRLLGAGIGVQVLGGGLQVEIFGNPSGTLREAAAEMQPAIYSYFQGK